MQLSVPVQTTVGDELQVPERLPDSLAVAVGDLLLEADRDRLAVLVGLGLAVGDVLALRVGEASLVWDEVAEVGEREAVEVPE